MQRTHRREVVERAFVWESVMEHECWCTFLFHLVAELGVNVSGVIFRCANLQTIKYPPPEIWQSGETLQDLTIDGFMRFAPASTVRDTTHAAASKSLYSKVPGLGYVGIAALLFGAGMQPSKIPCCYRLARLGITLEQGVGGCCCCSSWEILARASA
jgi:hypothetical protein